MPVKAYINVIAETHDAETGALLSRDETHNMVLNSGLDLIALILGNLAEPLSHLAVGTGVAAVLAANTGCQTEVYRSAITKRTATTAKLTVSHYLGTQAANGFTLTEAALHNAASGGNAYARVLLSASIVKTASITATLTWELTWSR